MHRCPHCKKPLGVKALLAMNTATLASCPHCGQRYGWDASGPGLLLIIAVVGAGVWGLIQWAPHGSPLGLVGGIAALIGFSGYLAVRSVFPIKR